MTSPTIKAGSKELKREVGFINLTWASMGSIIGSGWLFSSRNALGFAGPSAIFAWVVAAAALTILALVHAELGGMYPVSGGTARFPHFTFGGFAGASFGWFSWLQAATVAPIEVLAVLSYSSARYGFAKHWLFTAGPHSGLLTSSGLVAAVVLMALVTVLNMLTVRLLTTLNSVLTWWKIAIPVLTIVVLLIHGFHGSNFHAADGFAPGHAKGIFEAVASGGIIFALLGFEQADQLAGESKNPRRDVPMAIITSMIIGTIVYVLLEVAFTGALPPHLVPHSWLATNTPLANLTGPFAQVSSAVGLGWLATILYADAAISPGGTGLIYTTATSRVSYGLARNGYFPRPFEAVTQQRVPWFGLIVSFVIGCLIFLPFPSWSSVVNIITSISVLMYAGAPVALGALRKRLPDADRPYHLPAAGVIAPLAFVVADLIVMWTGWHYDWQIGLAIIAGYLLMGASKLLGWNGDNTPPLALRNSMWIPVWLGGVFLITLFSSFGHMNAAGVLTLHHLNFGWDALVMAVFSLVIYYWAVASALPAEAISAIVAETVIPEDQELAGVIG